MIFLLFSLLAADPPPLDIEPFSDEKPAASAFEAHLMCLAKGGFDHRSDPRQAGAVASDVVNACATKAATLRAALADVYRRKPALMPDGRTPETAASNYVDVMNRRMEFVIRQARKHK